MRCKVLKSNLWWQVSSLIWIQLPKSKQEFLELQFLWKLSEFYFLGKGLFIFGTLYLNRYISLHYSYQDNTVQFQVFFLSVFTVYYKWAYPDRIFRENAFFTRLSEILGAFWKLPYRRPNDLFITINFVSYTSILGHLHLQLTVWKFKNFSVTEKFPWNQFCNGIKINLTKNLNHRKIQLFSHCATTYTICFLWQFFHLFSQFFPKF